MRAAYTLSIVLLLLGCALGQLGFGGFELQPRPGTDVFDSTTPCSGRLRVNPTRIDQSPTSAPTLAPSTPPPSNDTQPTATPSITAADGVALVCFQVVGNHGYPNTVVFSVSDVDPTTQSDFKEVSEYTVTDGVLASFCFNYTMDEGTIRTFQLEYTTGDSFYVYCLDAQYGDIIDDDSGVDKLTFSASLSLLVVAVLAFVL